MLEKRLTSWVELTADIRIDLLTEFNADGEGTAQFVVTPRFLESSPKKEA